MKKILSIIVILFFVSTIAAAQTIIKPAYIGARNAALGDADISGSYNISSMYQNPASISFANRASIFINHFQIRNNLGMGENMAYPIIHNNTQSLAVGFETFHLGYLISPSYLTNKHILEFDYNLAYSTLVMPTLSIGALANLQYGRTNSTPQWASTLTLGIDYSPSPDISYGAVFRGIGSELRYNINNFSIFDQVGNPDRILEIGATMSYPSAATLRRKFLFLSFANEKLFGETGLFYKVGLELRPLDFLNLRFGYVSGPGVNDARYGIGFHVSDFYLEYALYGQRNTYMLEQFSLSFNGF